MKDLHLNVKAEYFDAIKSGEKVKEYRLYNDYWKKRLINNDYNLVLIKRGYPKKDDYSKIEARPYRGFTIETIVHKHFGNEPVEVFSIWVN